MIEKVRYIIQDFGGFFNEWHDRDMEFADKRWFISKEEAEKEMPTPQYRKSRVIKRVITEEVVVEETENKTPKPKFKVGQIVRSEGQQKGHLIITEVVPDSYWTDGHRWNYKVKAIDCKVYDANSSWREYELRPYNTGGVKPKQSMSVMCLTDDSSYDITKGQIYTVRKIWADGKIEIEDDEEDIVYLNPEQYRLTV